MRVLLTTDTIGGVWTFTRELTAGLLENCHQVALASLGRPPSPEQEAWVDHTGALSGGSFHYTALDTPLEWMQNNEEAYTSCAPALLSQIAQFKPDVVHSSQFCFGSLPVTTPIVITAHSDVLSWADACRPDGIEASPWLQRYTTLVQDGLNRADAVAAPTQHMLSALTNHFHVPCSTTVVPNGRHLPSAEDDSSERMLQAVSVGRLWDEAKGLSTLLEIDSPVPIVIAGEQQFGDAAVSSDAAKVTALGMLNEGDLLALFRRSSVYIAPSWYEPFGLAPLEAALCGCAVIARDIPSLREVWAEAALYFNSANDLERQLETLFASPKTLARFQLGAKRRAEQFTTARMTASYLALYQEVIRRHATSTGSRHKEFANHAA